MIKSKNLFHLSSAKISVIRIIRVPFEFQISFVGGNNHV